MSAQQDDHRMGGVEENTAATLDKGKGKAPEQTMEEAEEDSSDESGPEAEADVLDEADEDNMEEIDESNIVGSRTRGKTIDYAKANEELPEDDDEDDDEDFQADDTMMED